MGNEVRIDITVEEHAQLDRVATRGEAAGHRIGKAFEDSGGQIDRAFDKTSRQLINQLDKIEKEAWESGKGMDDAFGTALAGLRSSLGLVRTEAKETGAKLHSSLGDSLAEVRKGAVQLADSLKPVEQAAVSVNKAFDKTARMIGTELDRIERDAWSAGKGTDAAFQAALKSVRDDFDRVRAVGARTGASLESDLGGSLRDIKREMDRLGDEAKETGKEIEQNLGSAGAKGGSDFSEMLGSTAGGGFDVGGMIESLTGGAGGGLAAAGAAVGGAIAAAEWEAFNAYFDQREIGGIIAAQQGGTAAEAGKLGQVAGDAYYSGFADSVEEGGAALSGVLGQGLVDTSDSQSEIQKLTNMAATAAKVVGADANEVARAASQLIKNGLAKNAQEAMDLIVRASQAGVNAAGDMTSTIEEYATKFRDMGLSGKDAMGLMSQALGAGARDADIAADAIKEFSIRAIDGTALTARGFQALGLDSRKMAQDIGAGGDTARAALDKTLDGLRAIEDPVKRNQAAVDLFGTQAEDLGDALYSMDLDTVASQMDGVAGSTEAAAQTMWDTMSPIDKLGRGIEGAANIAIGGMKGMGGAADGASAGLEKAGEKARGFMSESELLAEAQEEAQTAIDEISGASAQYAETLQAVISAQEQLAGTYESSERAQLDYQAAIDSANESIKQNGQNTDIASEAGRNNKDTLLDLSDATWDVVRSMEQQGATSNEVQGFMASARDQFIQTAQGMGYSAEQANRMADKLRLIPGDYNARVGADTSSANRNLDFTLAKLRAIAAIHIAAVQVRASGGIIGGSIPGRETGGLAGAFSSVWGAQTGGVRHSSVVMNEAGPEVAELPTGSRVATAGATRALAEMGAFGGGGPTVVQISMAGGDDLTRAILNSLRVVIKDDHGGSVTNALGQRGAA